MGIACKRQPRVGIHIRMVLLVSGLRLQRNLPLGIVVGYVVVQCLEVLASIHLVLEHCRVGIRLKLGLVLLLLLIIV